MNDIKFESLGQKGRKILLTALKFDLDNLECYYCKEKVTYKNCGIMPAVTNHLDATIICSSPLCVSEYLNELDKKDNKDGKNGK